MPLDATCHVHRQRSMHAAQSIDIARAYDSKCCQHNAQSNSLRSFAPTPCHPIGESNIICMQISRVTIFAILISIRNSSSGISSFWIRCNQMLTWNQCPTMENIEKKNLTNFINSFNFIEKYLFKTFVHRRFHSFHSRIENGEKDTKILILCTNICSWRALISFPPLNCANMAMLP